MKPILLLTNIMFFISVVFFFILSVYCFGDSNAFSDSMFSKLTPEKKIILEEYHINYFKLKHFYNNALIIARENMNLYYNSINGERFYLPDETEPILAYSCDYEYRSNNSQYYRLDEKLVDANSSEKRIRIGIISPQQSYLLDKKNATSKYYSLIAKRDKIEETGPNIQDCLFPFAAFSERGTPLEYILFQKPFFAETCFVDDIVFLEKDGIEVVSISMTATNKKGKNVIYQFEFYRNYFWAIKSIVVSTDNNIYTTHNQYDFINDSIPLIKHSLIDVKAADGSKRYYRKEFEIKKIVSGAVPLSEFDVAQFLPPETKIGVTTASFSYFRLFCLIAGLLLLALGIYLKIRNARN